MSRRTTIRHEFVKTFPEKLEEGTIYVSMEYASVSHKCCCGCGNEVITPLAPTDWQLVYDGESISLSPSIGNWSFECQSHYWIKKNAIKWANEWTKGKIKAGRAHDHELKNRYYDASQSSTPSAEPSTGKNQRRGFWGWVSRLWS